MLRFWGTPAYERLPPEEYMTEAFRLLEQRIQLEKAVKLEYASRVGIADSTGHERTKQILKHYSMDAEIDIHFFDTRNTLQITIIPQVNDDGKVSFKRHMEIDGKNVKNSRMEQALKQISREQKYYISEMTKHHRYVLGKSSGYSNYNKH